MAAPEGFVGLKGAGIHEKTTDKSLSPGMLKLQEELMASNRVEKFVTAEDLLFSSLSAAAAFVLGCSTSGPQSRKTQDGHSLKVVE